ncbi:hypothetical protein LPJ59_004643, partial [Coemansia sp. RSA 2399]
MYYVIHVIDILMDLFVREPVSLDNYGANEGKWAGELGMKSKSYAVDFTTCTDDQWKDISAIIKERQVSIL